MTFEELSTELEKTISGLTSSGFDSIDACTVETLKKYSAVADELGMREGKRLIENLSTAMKAIQKELSKAESGNVRLTALDFYLEKFCCSDRTEDL